MLETQLNKTPFRLDEFDAEFSARTTAEDWQRTLEMRNQPNFTNAILKYHIQLEDVASGNIMLNKVVSESGRYEILAYLLYLYDSRDPQNSRSGLTITNLEKLCVSQNCASPGRVRAIIGLMWATGYLKRTQSILDSRVTHFEPTKKLMDIIESWNHEIFKAIDDIFPEDGLALRHLNEPRFGWNMRKSGTEQVLTGWKPFHLFPEAFHFVKHDAGWMLLLHCARKAIQNGNSTHIAAVAIDLAAFGSRFGVSRSHLRRLLEAAFTAGLLDAPPHNGTYIVLSRKLLASYFMSMASELQFYRKHALAGQMAQF